MGKMFALADVDLFESINLKCEPEKAAQLREEYASVLPGYHMSKKHWNTVLMDGSVPDKKVKEWIDDSYNLVASSLTKSQQKALEAL
jgi:predicted DNA-binding protein (MmcQ/YjbR family)